MSTIPAQNVTAAPGECAVTEPAGVARPRLRAGTTIGVHTLVDYFSFTVIALLPLLMVSLDMTNAQRALLIGVGSITSGVIQPVVAWISDRLDTRVLSTMGMVVAVVCVSMVGFARTYEQLLVLYAVGAAGVGAFHPPAAAAVGQLSGRRRAAGVAAFFVAGMLGGVLGNTTVPAIVDGFARMAPGGPSSAFGLRSLAWLMIPGLVAAVLLAWAIHRVPHRANGARDGHDALSRAERRARWAAVWLIYAGNVIRFSVNMALIHLVGSWAVRATLAQRGGEFDAAAGRAASLLNGPMQGMLQVGMGFGGLVLGFFLAVRREKAAFVAVPLVGAVVVAAVPWADRLPAPLIVPIAFLLTIGAGVGFGALVPVSISVAQRLLPHRTSLASGLMLGGAWCLAFVGPLGANYVEERASLEAAFAASGAALALAGLLALALPGRLLLRSAEDAVTES